MHAWVAKVFVEVGDDDVEGLMTQQQTFAKGLQTLYGKRVLPDDLLALFPLHFDFPHRLPGSEVGPANAAACAELLCMHVLHSETHPVVTRFWLFSAAVKRMLTTALLAKPTVTLVVDGVQPLPKQQKRLSLLHTFFGNEKELQTLKSAVLSLRLTDGFLAETAKKEKHGPPTVVRIGKSSLLQNAANLYVDLIVSFAADPLLDKCLALTSMSTTLLHIAGRLEQYKDYPYCLWKMCQAFNADTYLDECSQFLQNPPEALDAGSFV